MVVVPGGTLLVGGSAVLGKRESAVVQLNPETGHVSEPHPASGRVRPEGSCLRQEVTTFLGKSMEMARGLAVSPDVRPAVCQPAQY